MSNISSALKGRALGPRTLPDESNSNQKGETAVENRTKVRTQQNSYTSRMLQDLLRRDPQVVVIAVNDDPEVLAQLRRLRRLKKAKDGNEYFEVQFNGFVICFRAGEEQALPKVVGESLIRSNLMPRQEVCIVCGGKGSLPNFGFCSTCHGRKTVFVQGDTFEESHASAFKLVSEHSPDYNVFDSVDLAAKLKAAAPISLASLGESESEG